jgi:2-dehydropantoate 2-reductase
MRERRVRSYAIIGAGALGGWYGARLHHAGCSVHFLLHSDYAQVTRNGLRVESPCGEFSVRAPQAYQRPQDMPACDVALVGLKTTQNHLLPQLLPPVVRRDGCVLVMQNGLGVEELAAAAVNRCVQVLGGMAFLCSHKVGPGHIRHMDYGDVRLGHYSPDGRPAGLTRHVQQVAEDFTRAGVTVHVEEDLVLARWKKLVWNVPYNGLSVVLNATTDKLMADQDTRALCEALMLEVVEGAAAFGRAISRDFVQLMLANTEQMVAYKPSMMLDWEQGRPMEIEAIHGNPLRAAAGRGIVLPRLSMLYQQLRFLSARVRCSA